MTSSVIQGQHPIVACARGIRELLGSVADVQPVFMATGDKQEALIELERVRASLTELELRVLAAADDVAESSGARDAASWLAHQVHAEPAAVRAEQRLATSLDNTWTRVASGMRDGRVSQDQAVVIVRALEDLPSSIEPATLAEAEATLVGLAEHHRPSELRRLGRRILEVVAPEVADDEEAKRLHREEQAAREKASLRFRKRGDGTTAFSGVMPDADAARWLTYLDAFTTPRHRDDGPMGEADRIPRHRKLAHAFIALLEALDPSNLPEHGGDATTVMVMVGFDALKAKLATAGLIDEDLAAGPNLSAEQARRLACTAKIIPVVLGGKGEILDLGRARRLFTPAQRKAIKLRDQRCRAEGCTVAATWCDAHHLQPWSTGGATNLDDGISLCNWHHHRIHDHGYRHERLANGDVRFHRRT